MSYDSKFVIAQQSRTAEKQLEQSENFEIRELHPLALIFAICYAGFCILEGVLSLTIFTNLIILAIGYICGNHAASKWAPKIQGSKTWAFMIPFLFNLLGLFFYWVYFLDKRNKMNK
jgi:hypothetical protein